MKTYDKLVRDRIPEILEREGLEYEVEELDADAFMNALRAKLVEEAQEAAEAEGHDLVKELGDVLEVLDALVRAAELDMSRIEDLRDTRRNERGGFERRLLLRWTRASDTDAAV